MRYQHGPSKVEAIYWFAFGFGCILVLWAALLLNGCGSGGGTATDSSNTQTNGAPCPPGAVCPTSTDEVRCVFGDGTVITISVGDNSQLAFCEHNGGTVEDLPTTNSNNPSNNNNNQPTNSNNNNSTTNNNAPKNG
jgi:hypothetical protein